MASSQLSAVVITKNAASTIDVCLNSLSFADEIIVVDSGSTDQTLTIARQYTDKVFTNPWPGYGLQKNFASTKTAHDWNLFVDADEQVTPELATTITKAIANPLHDFYWLRIITVFLSRPLKHLYGHNPRLFRKSIGSWTAAEVHEQVVESATGQQLKLGDNKSALLSGNLLHHSHPTIKSYLTKMDTYTALDAKEMVKTNHHRSGRPIKKSWFLPFHLAVRQFIKLLFYRKGILDGIPGIIWCTASAYYEFDMARKYLKLPPPDSESQRVVSRRTKGGWGSSSSTPHS